MSPISLRRIHYASRSTPWFSARKRVANVNSNPWLRSYIAAKTKYLGSYSTLSRRPSVLRLYEDRRYWHPEGNIAPARSFSHPRHRLKTVVPRSRQNELPYKNVGYSPVPYLVGFRNPSRVLICVRRKQRREVMFAMGYGGKAGNQFRHRTSEYSDVRC